MSRTRRTTSSTQPREDEHDDALDRVFPRATLKPRPTAQSVQKREAQPPPVREEKRAYPQRVAVSRPPALTEREEKVRRILLKELGGLNASTNGADGLSYVERQKLEKTLDVDYLDAEIKKVEGQLKHVGWFKNGIIILSIVSVLAIVFALYSGADLSSLIAVLSLPMSLWAGFATLKALQRRLFILEALRALSDADEMDVVLDRVTLDADRLISEITQRALSAESSASR